jgi:hypothetical protein
MLHNQRLVLVFLLYHFPPIGSYSSSDFFANIYSCE